MFTSRIMHSLWQLRIFSAQQPKFQDRFHRQESTSLFSYLHCRNEPGNGKDYSVNEKVHVKIGHPITVENRLLFVSLASPIIQIHSSPEATGANNLYLRFFGIFCEPWLKCCGRRSDDGGK